MSRWSTRTILKSPDPGAFDFDHAAASAKDAWYEEWKVNFFINLSHIKINDVN